MSTLAARIERSIVRRVPTSSDVGTWLPVAPVTPLLLAVASSLSTSASRRVTSTPAAMWIVRAPATSASPFWRAPRSQRRGSIPSARTERPSLPWPERSEPKAPSGSA